MSESCCRFVWLFAAASLAASAPLEASAAPTAAARPAVAAAESAVAEKPIARIAFGSCLGQDLPQPVWDHVVAARPDLFVFLGDNVYADTHDMEALRAAYAKLAAQPGFQRLRRSTKILATWDDHDYCTDDSGADCPSRAQSQQVFLDFFEVSKSSPRRRREGVYDAELFGPPGRRVQILLLDTRYHRSPLQWVDKKVDPEGGRYVPNTDPSATLLGAAQWKWLEEQLRAPAQVRIVASSIQVVSEEYGGEKWSNFPLERKRLFELIWNSRVTGLLFISGDVHFAELSMMDGEVGFPVYDLTSSSLNWSEYHWRPLRPNRHRVGALNTGDHFGLIEIDWERPDPLIRLKLIDSEGDVALQRKMPLSDLRDGTIPW